MFSYNEIKGNLFDYEGSYALAQWISADFDCSRGIAALMESRSKVSRSLKEKYRPGIWLGRGYCRISNDGNVFNLITTAKYNETPTLERICEALKDMRKTAEKIGVSYIAMPRITGLDWQLVHDAIFDVFRNSDFNIRVVYDKEYLEVNFVDPDVEKINHGRNRKNIDGNTLRRYY